MQETKYISKEYTNCLRGIFSILVVIHHLYQYSGLFRGMYIGVFLQLLGFISVAMFFFFSGYGLMLSSQRKNYIDGFFIKRFLPLYSFYVLLIVLYSLWTLLLERSFSPKLFIQSFLFGGTIVTNGWYLQTTFVVYLLYLVIFKKFKSQKIQIFSFGICVCAYCILCHLMGLGINWYQTVPCMVLGMIYYCKKDYIDVQLKKHAWVLFILSGILFAACFVLSAKSGIPVIFNVLYALLFVCSMISLSYILANTSLIHNRFNAFCGDYSLEIYVTHGLFLRLIKLKYIEQIPIYIIVVIIGTILMSIIMKRIYIIIVSLFEKAYKKSHQ